MSEGQDKKWRRFSIRRRVDTYEIKTREQRELEEAARAKDDKGPLDDGGMKKGCFGCLGALFLLIVIMVASIVATCALPRDWSLLGR